MYSDFLPLSSPSVHPPIALSSGFVTLLSSPLLSFSLCPRSGHVGHGHLQARHHDHPAQQAGGGGRRLLQGPSPGREAPSAAPPLTHHPLPLPSSLLYFSFSVFVYLFLFLSLRLSFFFPQKIFFFLFHFSFILYFLFPSNHFVSLFQLFFLSFVLLLFNSTFLSFIFFWRPSILSTNKICTIFT